MNRYRIVIEVEASNQEEAVDLFVTFLDGLDDGLCEKVEESWVEEATLSWTKIKSMDSIL